MSRRTRQITTAVQSNYSFAAVDDYDNRMYILPHLLTREGREKIIEEHRANPMYRGTRPGEPPAMNSEPLRRLLDRLRASPQAGKHTIVETRPWEEYTIGILPGWRGAVIELTEETYPTRGEAEHAIFLKRLRSFLEEYGIEL